MTPLPVLIDRRRELAAKLAGVELEIAWAFGDTEAAFRALREMEAQTIARRAARQPGCYFLERGEEDRRALEAVHG